MDQDYLEPHFAEPYHAWMATPSPENASTLLKAVNPVINSALKSYGLGAQQSPTLRSHAKLMTLDAIKRYDPTKAKLQTHLMFQLQGLRRMATRESQILSVPEQVALDIGHLRDSENFLQDKLGRDPSTAELADHMKMSAKRIHYIRRAKPTYSESLLQRATEDGEDVFSPAVTQLNDRRAHGTVEMLYHDLSPVDQLIIEHTMGLHGKPILQNKDLATKLHVSPGAVSQRKAKIQQKLDEFSDINLFGE